MYTKLKAAMKEVDKLNLSVMKVLWVITEPHNTFNCAELKSIQVLHFKMSFKNTCRLCCKASTAVLHYAVRFTLLAVALSLST